MTSPVASDMVRSTVFVEVADMTFLALLAMTIGVLLALALALVGLIEAPWPVLLVGLLVAFYSLQRLLGDGPELLPPSTIGADGSGPDGSDIQSVGPAPSAITHRSKASPSAKTGQAGAAPGEDSPPSSLTSAAGEELTYRGIRYRAVKGTSSETEPKSESTEVGGIYRGQRWWR